MGAHLTPSTLAAAFLQVYRELVAPSSGSLSESLRPGKGVAAQVALLEKMQAGYSLSTPEEFRLYMALTLDIVCLDIIAGRASRSVRDLPRIQDAGKLGRASDRRGLLTKEPAQKVGDWMLEKRIHAWSLTAHLGVTSPPAGGKKCEFMVTSDLGKEAVECKRLNNSQCDDAYLLSWIQRKTREAEAQLSSSVREEDTEKTLVLDLTQARDTITPIEMHDGHRLELLTMSERRRTETLEVIEEAARAQGVDTVIMVCDQGFLLEGRPAAVRMSLHPAVESARGTALASLGWTAMLPIMNELEAGGSGGGQLQVHSKARSDTWIAYELFMVGSQGRFWGTWDWHPARR